MGRDWLTQYDDQAHSWNLVMKTIDASEFDAQCLALIEHAVESGESLLIAKDGKPLVELRPLPGNHSRGERPRTLFGMHKGQIEILGDIISPIGDESDGKQ